MAHLRLRIPEQLQKGVLARLKLLRLLGHLPRVGDGGQRLGHGNAHAPRLVVGAVEVLVAGLRVRERCHAEDGRSRLQRVDADGLLLLLLNQPREHIHQLCLGRLVAKARRGLGKLQRGRAAHHGLRVCELLTVRLGEFPRQVLSLPRPLLIARGVRRLCILLAAFAARVGGRHQAARGDARCEPVCILEEAQHLGREMVEDLLGAELFPQRVDRVHSLRAHRRLVDSAKRYQRV